MCVRELQKASNPRSHDHGLMIRFGIGKVGKLYQDLYIYHLSGWVNEKEEKELGSHFLGNWVEDDFSFLFFSAPAVDKIKALIKNHAALEWVDDYHFSYEQWQGGGMEPIRIGPFLIETPWSRTGGEDDVIRIILDPGVVFGTGLHPTTRDCLKALAWLQERETVARVLDIGTGTGILAIAALGLGAKEAVAVDLNPLCVKTAQTNVVLNGFENRIRVIRGRAEDFVGWETDLVIANIHYDVLKTMIREPDIIRRKWMILSGLMRSQARDMKARIKDSAVDLVREWDHEMTWYTLLVKGACE
jgi:ribosomal protein L11 methyltransferase